MATKKTGVKVAYKFIDGAHFFVGEDKEALGLCVAHADLATAWAEVPYQLNVLFEQNHGKKTNFAPNMPFDAFKKMIDAFLLVVKGTGVDEVIPSSIQPWMYQENKGLV
jgi:hypothetical protein